MHVIHTDGELFEKSHLQGAVADIASRLRRGEATPESAGDDLKCLVQAWLPELCPNALELIDAASIEWTSGDRAAFFFERLTETLRPADA